MADLTGVNPDLASAVQALVNMSHGRITIISGTRSAEQQAKLYNTLGPGLAVPPGSSNHETGDAVDLGGDVALIRQLAPQVGLVTPMAWDPYHVELPSTPGKSDPSAYTPSPYGDPNPTSDPNLASSPESILATMSGAMRSLITSAGEQSGPVTSAGQEATGPAGSNTPSGPIGTVPLEAPGTGGDKRVPGHSIEQWAKDILSGLGAPDTPQNLSALTTWADRESGGYNPSASGGRYNPLNTTEGALGYAGQGGSQGNIKDFSTYEQGVANQVYNLLNTQGAGYEPIVAALRAGNDPQAVFSAVNASKFGTHF